MTLLIPLLMIVFLFVTAKVSLIAIQKRYARGLREGYDNGYEAGYSAGYEGAAYDLQKSLGRARFQDLLQEVKHEGARPKSWRERRDAESPKTSLTTPEGMIE